MAITNIIDIEYKFIAVFFVNYLIAIIAIMRHVCTFSRKVKAMILDRALVTAENTVINLLC